MTPCAYYGYYYLQYNNNLNTELGCRTAIDANEQHDVEVASARDATADAAAMSSTDIIQHFEGAFSLSFHL